MEEATEITTSWHSYPSPKQLGHGMIMDLLKDPVIVEEKLDGSQFSFGVFGGELKCRSKGAQLNLFAPEKMFIQGIEQVKAMQSELKDGWTYRCEYFQKPKHNSLAYSRIPVKHLMVLDINDGHETYLSYSAKKEEAARIGLETTPLLYEGEIHDPSIVRELLNLESVLGGAKIEGVVIKNYKRFTVDGKAMMGKFVSEEFKEIHGGEWRKENPDTGDIIDQLVARYRTPARWQKAVQHLKEAGKIQGQLSDLQHMFPEVVADTQRECEQEVKEILFKWAWSKVARSLTGGMPDWYKEQLMKSQFEEASK